MNTPTFVKGPLINPIYKGPLQINFERVYLHRPWIDFDESVQKYTTIHLHFIVTISFGDSK